MRASAQKIKMNYRPSHSFHELSVCCDIKIIVFFLSEFVDIFDKNIRASVACKGRLFSVAMLLESG